MFFERLAKTTIHFQAVFFFEFTLFRYLEDTKRENLENLIKYAETLSYAHVLNGH